MRTLEPAFEHGVVESLGLLRADDETGSHGIEVDATLERGGKGLQLVAMTLQADGVPGVEETGVGRRDRSVHRCSAYAVDRGGKVA